MTSRARGATGPGLRVLFVGNSITYVHDTPALLTHLVASDPANRPIFAVRFAPGGQWLAQDVDDPQLDGLLTRVHWNEVVLQEQSELPGFSLAQRELQMYPAARTLAARIAENGAQLLFFATGAWRDGDIHNFPGDSFGAMEARIEGGYSLIAGDLKAPTAPVGAAYALALQEHPGTPLWEPDGDHPSLEGAYLAACVFYDVLYHRAPTSSFTAGLDPDEAAFLQRTAAAAVREHGTGVRVRAG